MALLTQLKKRLTTATVFVASQLLVLGVVCAYVLTMYCIGWALPLLIWSLDATQGKQARPAADLMTCLAQTITAIYYVFFHNTAMALMIAACEYYDLLMGLHHILFGHIALEHEALFPDKTSDAATKRPPSCAISAGFELAQQIMHHEYWPHPHTCFSTAEHLRLGDRLFPINFIEDARRGLEEPGLRA